MRSATWKRIARNLALALLLPATSPAQTKPFDVITIKPSDTTECGMGLGRSTPDSISLINTPVKSLIARAYTIREDSIVAPGSALSKEYDIEAKILPDASGGVARLNYTDIQDRMKLLLSDRFHLAAHFETRSIPVYELTLALSGSKLKQADPAETYPNGIKGPNGRTGPGLRIIQNSHFTGQAIPFSDFVDTLEMLLHRTVVDKTHLDGRYDISIPLPPEQPNPDPDASTPPSSPSLTSS